MGEKQVKRNRKGTAKVSMPKKRADKATVITNIIITVVILAVFGLGAYAVGTKYYEKWKASQPVPEKTVADFIGEQGITFEEFKTQYGIAADDAEVTEESAIDAVAYKFSLDNYAKYTGTTVEELKTQYGLGEDVPNTTSWQDAMNLMPTGTYVQNFFGMDFESFKTQMGMPEEITAEMTWGETSEIMNALVAEQQAAAEAESAETATDAPAEEVSADTEQVPVEEEASEQVETEAEGE